MTAEPQPGLWRPSNDVEHQLLEVLSRDDRQAFFAILSTAPLYLPVAISDPAAATGRPDRPEDYLTVVSGGVTYLLVFTSLETLRGLLGEVATGHVESSFEVLRANLAGSDVRLGLNPGTPIDAWLDAESLARAAAGELFVPTGLEMAESMADEAPAQEVDSYVDHLIKGDMHVTTDGGIWRITAVDGVPTIEAYSTEGAVPPGTQTVAVPFTQLVARWPVAAQQLSVNANTPLAFTLSADMLTAFAEQLRRY